MTAMIDDELDETTFPAWRDAIASHPGGVEAPRSYPGYPRWALPAMRRRWLGASSMTLARALATRRSAAALATELPDARTLGTLLHLAHGITGADGRGPTPSAGGLQALELYLATWSPGWLPEGWYHFDRAAHALAQLAPGATRDGLGAIVPSLATVEGGALVWILVGDHARVEARYGRRAGRFLLLEAGHLMQSLCLASTAAGWTTVPLGGSFERALGRALHLPRTDRVLVTALLGRGARA